jgi:hypothetical protein
LPVLLSFPLASALNYQPTSGHLLLTTGQHGLQWFCTLIILTGRGAKDFWLCSNPYLMEKHCPKRLIKLFCFPQTYILEYILIAYVFSIKYYILK